MSHIVTDINTPGGKREIFRISQKKRQRKDSSQHGGEQKREEWRGKEESDRGIEEEQSNVY